MAELFLCSFSSAKMKFIRRNLQRGGLQKMCVLYQLAYIFNELLIAVILQQRENPTTALPWQSQMNTHAWLVSLHRVLVSPAAPPWREKHHFLSAATYYLVITGSVLYVENDKASMHLQCFICHCFYIRVEQSCLRLSPSLCLIVHHPSELWSCIFSFSFFVFKESRRSSFWHLFYISRAVPFCLHSSSCCACSRAPFLTLAL